MANRAAERRRNTQLIKQKQSNSSKPKGHHTPKKAKKKKEEERPVSSSPKSRGSSGGGSSKPSNKSNKTTTKTGSGSFNAPKGVGSQAKTTKSGAIGSASSKTNERRAGAQRASGALANTKAATAGKLVGGTAKYTVQRWAGYAAKGADSASKAAISKAGTGRKGGATTATRSTDRGNKAQVKKQQTQIQQRKENKKKAEELKANDYTVARRKYDAKTGKSTTIYEAYNKGTQKAVKKIDKAKEKTLENTTEGFSGAKNKEIGEWVDKIPGANKMGLMSGKKQRETMADQAIKESGLTGADAEKERKRLIKKYEQEGVGKLSSKDIARGGVEMASEMVDYMIPYAGTTGKALKGAEKAVKALRGGKALTETTKAGGKVLTKEGKSEVAKIAAGMVKKGTPGKDAIKLAKKKVMRSDKIANIEKELIANAAQDATIGTALDYAKGKEQGLKGKEMADYMKQNAVMNAVFGGAFSAVGGRTTRAGKAALKEEIAESINKGFNLTPAEAKELKNLGMIKSSAEGNAKLKGGSDKNGFTPEQQARYDELTKKAEYTDNVVKVNDKGKIVPIDKEATNVLSPAQRKEYFKLRADEKAGIITGKDKTRLQALDSEVKSAQKMADNNANTVLEYGGKKDVRIDRDTLEMTVKHFENTGETAKLKKAQKLLDDTVKAENDTKQKQLDVIKKTNAKDDSLADHTWVESVNDIKTFDEAVKTGDGSFTPDYTEKMAAKAIESGEIKVYSSKPIEDGAFVTPSKMEAEAYAGSGKLYEATIKTEDVAWIDELQGQVAKISESNFTKTFDDVFESGRINKNDVKTYLKEAHKEVYSNDKRALDIATDAVEELRNQRGKIRNASGKAYPETETVADAFSRDLITKGRVDLKGRVIRNVEDLAEEMQVFRDPRFETFRVIYMKGDAVVASEGISSRMPGLSATTTRKTTETKTASDVMAQTFSDMKRRMKRLGSDGYYLVHNHPSGKLDLSDDDAITTARFTMNVPGFKDHVILDHDTFGVVDFQLVQGGLSARTIKHKRKGVVGDDALKTASVDHPLLGEKINSSSTLADALKAVEKDDRFIATLVYVDSGGRITGIENVSSAIINNQKAFSGYARNRARNFGGRGVFVGTSDSATYELAKSYISRGDIVDCIQFENAGTRRSLVADEGLRKPNDLNFGKRDEEYPGRNVGEPPQSGSFNGETPKAISETETRKPSAAETRITKRYDDAIKGVDSGNVDDNILRDIEVRHDGDTWADYDGVILTPEEVKSRITDFKDNYVRDQKKIDNDPRYAPFREMDDLKAEWDGLVDKYGSNMPKEVEARGDEIGKRMDELTDEVGGNFEAKREQALRDIRSDMAKKGEAETKPKTKEEVDNDLAAKNESEDYKPLKEGEIPEPAKTPEGVEVDKKARKEARESVRETLKGNARDPQEFSKAELKEIDDEIDKISNEIANGNMADARADAEALARKHGQVDKNYFDYDAEAARKLKELQKDIKSQTFQLPATEVNLGKRGSRNEYLEVLGPENRLNIRKTRDNRNVMGTDIDDYWDEAVKLYPERLDASITSPEKRFKALNEVLSMDAEKSGTYMDLPDDEIENIYKSMGDDIYDAALKNADGYRKPGEAKNDLKNVDEMSPGQLEKERAGLERHLENAKKKYGDDSPRAKQLEGQLDRVNKRLEEYDAEVAKANEAANKARGEGTPEGKPKGIESLYNDKDLKGIKETTEENVTRRLETAEKELKEATKNYGKDSPRAKEAQSIIDDCNERLEDIKHEKETGQKTENTADPVKPLDTAELTVDMPRTRFGKVWRELYRTSVDSFADVERLAKKIGGETGQKLLAQTNATRNAKNIAGTWIEAKRSNWNRETTGGSLNDIFKGIGGKKSQKRADFYDYCYHKHNLERLKNEKPISGMPREAEESLKAIEELEKKYGKSIKDFQQGVVKYADDLLQYKVDAGIVSKAEAAVLRKYENYIPTFTKKEIKGSLMEDAGMGIKVDRGVMKAKGGNIDDELVDLYDQLVQCTRSTMKHCEMNELIRMIGDANGVKYSDLSQKVSPDEMLENSLFTSSKDGKFTATYFDPDGAHTVDIPEEIYLGIREWSGEEKAFLMTNIGTRAFSMPGRVFKGLVTGWNVIFAARNGVRDLATALTYTKDLKGFAKSYPKALKEVITHKGPYYDAYMAAGGKFSSLTKSGGADGFLATLESSRLSPLHYITEFNDMIETMPRMAEFISTVDKAGGIEGAGKSVIDRAMKNANDVTLNFGRSGIVGRALNSGFVPYLNPSIQGLDKLARVFTEAKQEKNMRGLIGLGMKMSTFAIAPAVFNEFMLRDNEDYQQLETREKDANYFIPLGDGKFIKIPKARELVVVAEPFQYFFRHAQFGDSGGWRQMFTSAIDNIGVVNPLTDNLVSPLIRVGMNKTWFGGKIESAYEVENLLPQDRYDEGTTLFSIGLAQKAIPKALGLSPKKIDNIIDSYTGILGDMFIPMNAQASKGNFFVNKFVTDSAFSNKLSGQMWDRYSLLEQKAKSKTLSEEEVTKAKYEAQDLKNKYVEDTITLNNAITDIQANKDLSKTEKNQMVRELKKSLNEIYRASADGSEPKLNGKPVDPLKAIYNLYNGNKSTRDKAVGIAMKYAGKDQQEAYNLYKESDEYKKLSGKDRRTQRAKFLNYVVDGRDVQGKIGDRKDWINWKTMAVIGAQKGYSEAMQDSFGVYDHQKETAKTYKDYKYDLKHYVETGKVNFKAARELGLDYMSNLQSHDIAMSQAEKKRDDGSYFIGDDQPKYQTQRMPAARYLTKKNSKKWTKEEIHDFADKNSFDYKSDYDAVYKQAKKTYKNYSEKEWAAIAQVITNTGNNDFGDTSLKKDTGIFDGVEDDGKGGGRGYGRRRGRRGRGGGGGGGRGKKGTMPKTASGAIKGKVTDPFAKTTNGSRKSNLDDAYRKKYRKLVEESRKKH